MWTDKSESSCFWSLCMNGAEEFMTPSDLWLWLELWIRSLAANKWVHTTIFESYLSKAPVELHAFGNSVAAFNESRSGIHIHQALVIVIINGGTQDAHEQLLSSGVVYILQWKKRRAKEETCYGIKLNDSELNKANRNDSVYAPF